MSYAQIYTMVTSLLFGYAMDTTLFNNFLDIAQAKYENMRPWMVLRADDSSVSVGASSTFTTPLSIAPTNSDFRKWFGVAPIVLVDSQNNPMGFTEIPIGQKFSYKDTSQKFYCDYTQNKFYLCGAITQSYTVHQFYIKKSTLISAGSSNTWVFPSEYSKILALEVALMWKGVDYDIINNQNAAILKAQIDQSYDQMSRWDSDLQNSAQQGVDPFGSDGLWQGNSSGGRIG